MTDLVRRKDAFSFFHNLAELPIPLELVCAALRHPSVGKGILATAVESEHQTAPQTSAPVHNNQPVLGTKSTTASFDGKGYLCNMIYTRARLSRNEREALLQRELEGVKLNEELSKYIQLDGSLWELLEANGFYALVLAPLVNLLRSAREEPFFNLPSHPHEMLPQAIDRLYSSVETRQLAMPFADEATWMRSLANATLNTHDVLEILSSKESLDAKVRSLSLELLLDRLEEHNDAKLREELLDKLADPRFPQWRQLPAKLFEENLPPPTGLAQSGADSADGCWRPILEELELRNIEGKLGLLVEEEFEPDPSYFNSTNFGNLFPALCSEFKRVELLKLMNKVAELQAK